LKLSLVFFGCCKKTCLLLLAAKITTAVVNEVCEQIEDHCWDPIRSNEASCASRQIGCLHAAALGWGPYPFTVDMLARSIPYEADVSRVYEVMQKAEAGGTFDVVVLGGSVTLGRHAYTSNGELCAERACSWVARFEEWARRRFPLTSINVQNEALAACASNCQVSLLGTKLPADAPVDLVLLDLSINDGWAYNDHYLGKKQPQARNDNTPASV
jgi:hypothetical protein